ncbi:hypothetical protein ACRQ5D_22810 [Mucilaginibacter sp. P25]|uniref:hypothetical protein n=1 Tax=unclassified Mucilaginibacter TaxID=2617802 RepID=UPI003D67AA44
MNPYTFNISLYDLASTGTIFIGLNFSLLLWFGKGINRVANRLLAVAMITIVLWMVWALCADIGLATYFPRWNWLPLQFSLAFGPLIYFYVLKIVRPDRVFGWKDLLHSGPVLAEQFILLLEIKESLRTSEPIDDTLTFQQMSPVLHLAAFISVIVYLVLSFRLIENYYRGLKFNRWGDRYRLSLRWLHRWLNIFGVLWLLWIPFTAINYFYYHNARGIYACYPLYLLLTVAMIRITAVAFLKPEKEVPAHVPVLPKSGPSAALRKKECG